MPNYIQLNQGLRQLGDSFRGVSDMIHNSETRANQRRITDLAVRKQNNEERKEAAQEYGRQMIHLGQLAENAGMDPEQYIEQNPEIIMPMVENPSFWNPNDRRKHLGDKKMLPPKIINGQLTLMVDDGNGAAVPATTASGNLMAMSTKQALARLTMTAAGQGVVDARTYLSSLPVGSPEHTEGVKQIKPMLAQMPQRYGVSVGTVVTRAEAGKIGDEVDNTYRAAATAKAKEAEPQAQKVQSTELPQIAQDVVDQSLAGQLPIKSLRGPTPSYGTNPQLEKTDAGRPTVTSTLRAMREGPELSEEQQESRKAYEEKLGALQVEHGLRKNDSLASITGEVVGNTARDIYNNVTAPFLAGTAQVGEELVSGIGDFASSLFGLGDEKPSPEQEKKIAEASKTSSLMKDSNPGNAEKPEEFIQQAEKIAAAHRGTTAPLYRKYEQTIEEGFKLPRYSKEQAQKSAAAYANMVTLGGGKPDPRILANLMAGDDMRGTALEEAKLGMERARIAASNRATDASMYGHQVKAQKNQITAKGDDLKWHKAAREEMDTAINNYVEESTPAGIENRDEVMARERAAITRIIHANTGGLATALGMDPNKYFYKRSNPQAMVDIAAKFRAHQERVEATKEDYWGRVKPRVFVSFMPKLAIRDISSTKAGAEYLGHQAMIQARMEAPDADVGVHKTRAAEIMESWLKGTADE